MSINMRKYALVGLFLLAVVHLSSGFNVGSRGLTDGDMKLERRAAVEQDAGNNNEQIKDDTNQPRLYNPKLLQVLSNKEYLFGDEDASHEIKDDFSGPVEQKTLSAEPQDHFADGSDDEEEDGSHLKREQRTHPESMKFNDEGLKSLMEEFFKLEDIKSSMDDEYNQESNIGNYPYYDYNLLMNSLNAEDDMQTKEEKGSFLQAPESDDQDLESYGDYLEDSDLGSFFREQLQHGKELDSSFFDEKINNVAEDNHEDDTSRIVKPIIHYKETFISGDSYNKKLLDQDALNSDFKYVSESVQATSFPDHAKKNKLQFEDPLHRNQMDSLRNQSDYLFISVIAGCAMSALLAVLAGGACYYKINKAKAAGFESGKAGLFGGTAGLTKSNSLKSNASSSSGDRRLAQSAQMFHYQHQKQQMIAMEKANNDTKQDQSDQSEGEAEEGDYTVYECPGLAPTGEMEVKNPLFKEDFPSSNNILTSSASITSMPPPYATVSTDATTASEKKKEDSADQIKLIEVNETTTEAKATAALVNTESEKQ